MIQGTVTAGMEAVVRLRVHGPAVSEDVDVVVDTGYDGYLALPPDTVTRLGLQQFTQVRVVYADGSSAWRAVHSAEVEWDGSVVTVSVTAVGEGPLLGMGMLYGHSLHIEAVTGGHVEVRPIP